MKVVEELIAWAGTLPAWQADAVRRIWVNNTLSATDVDEVYQYCKAEHGLGSTATKPQPFNKDHVASGTVHQQVAVLKGLLPVKNVNAITTDVPLRFEPQGVTIVYGDNAAGKSGYSRILKRACRARGATVAIYPNVFDASAPKEPAQAEIYVEIDGSAETSLKWTDSAGAPECLANIAVFDSQTARLYIDEANEVRYIPYGLDVFGKLANLCQNYRSRLQVELSVIPKDPDVVEELVGSGKPFSAISVETTDEFIDEHTPFTEADDKQLEELRKQLAKLIAQDPIKEAAGWKRLQSRIQQLRLTLSRIRQLCSDEAAGSLKERWQELQDARNAADLAAKEAFGSEPVKGTGGEAWRILFDAARRFSEVDAYPGRSFPVTDDEGRCVLCQQPLSPEAKDRLIRFWEFIQKDVATTVRSKKRALTDAAKEFSAIPSHIARIDQSLIEELDEHHKGIDETTKTAISSYQTRNVKIEAALDDGNWDAITDLPADIGDDLITLETHCNEHIQRCEANANATEREKTEKEVTAFEFRQLAFKSRPVLKAYLRNLQVKAKLIACIKAVDTTNITKKGNLLMEQALTSELRKALNTECDDLGARGIPLHLKKSGSYGSTLHQVGLKDAQVMPSGVLSDGEQRVVAIASFLAELGTSEHNCGVVFDDPVCSLDHRYRRKVAGRLAREGMRRQVIVFTHDLLFLSMLRQSCELKKIPCLIESVRRVGSRCGVCDDTIPWFAMKTKQRISALRAAHQELKVLYDQGNHQEYARRIGDCYGHLREGWERAVEEVLLQDCIQRFEPEVQTRKLRYVTVTKEDYEAVEKGMTKCSAWMTGHDHAAADNSPVPEPAELLSDINDLDAFAKAVRRRQEGKLALEEQRTPVPPVAVQKPKDI